MALIQSHFPSIGIIGYGRFGRLLSKVLTKAVPEVDIRVWSRSAQPDSHLVDQSTALASSLIIPAVPIREFASTMANIAPQLNPGQVVLDVCSVKLMPRAVMLKELAGGIDIVASHPMFGPASYEKLGNTLNGCTIVLEAVRCNPNKYKALITLFKSMGLNILEIDAEEHDRLAARSQFITLTHAMVLKQLNLRRSRIDTASTEALLDCLEMISVDLTLVEDLYRFNPFCKKELSKLITSFNKLTELLAASSKEESR